MSAILSNEYPYSIDRFVSPAPVIHRYSFKPSSLPFNIENKQLFSGESNVYTLGNIGAHRIVCTKLPTVGHTREAMTAAGNTTTRLLGIHEKLSKNTKTNSQKGLTTLTMRNFHLSVRLVFSSCPGNG